MALRKITLTKGFVTIVDEEDYEYLNQWKWHYTKVRNDGYAVRWVRISPTKLKIVRMHRLIMNPPDEMYIDHINGDRLDNRKCNLRVCTNIQNSWNRKINKGRKYKGICFEKRRGKWKVYIDVNKKRISLGYFDSEEDAARIYNKAAEKYFGEFARLNVI